MQPVLGFNEIFKPLWIFFHQNCATAQLTKTKTMVKADLVFLQFWMKSVSLKPFMSPSHRSWLHFHLSTHSSAGSSSCPSLHSSTTCHLLQYLPDSTPPVYFHTHRAACDVILVLSTCGSHQGCDNFLTHWLMIKMYFEDVKNKKMTQAR